MAHWIRAIRQNGLTRSFWQLYFHTDMKAGTLVGTDRLGNNYYESSQEPWGTFCLWEITYHSLEKKSFCLFFENLLRSWQVGWVQKVLVGRRQPDPRWMVKIILSLSKISSSTPCSAFFEGTCGFTRWTTLLPQRPSSPPQSFWCLTEKTPRAQPRATCPTPPQSPSTSPGCPRSLPANNRLPSSFPPLVQLALFNQITPE